MGIAGSVENDIELLLDCALEQTIQLLSKYGEFFPVAVELLPDGEAGYVMIDIGEERPPSQALIDMFITAFAERAAGGALKAAAIAYDIHVTRGGIRSDAIAIRLEHVAGPSFLSVHPYTRDGADVVLGRGYIEDIEPMIFRAG